MIAQRKDCGANSGAVDLYELLCVGFEKVSWKRVFVRVFNWFLKMNTEI